MSEIFTFFKINFKILQVKSTKEQFLKEKSALDKAGKAKIKMLLGQQKKQEADMNEKDAQYETLIKEKEKLQNEFETLKHQAESTVSQAVRFFNANCLDFAEILRSQSEFNA